MCCMLITVSGPLPASFCRATYDRVKVLHVRACSYLLPDFTLKAVSCYINAFVTGNKPGDHTERTKDRFCCMGSVYVIYFIYDNPVRLLLLDPCVISALEWQSAL